MSLPNIPPKLFTLSAVALGYLLIDDLTANEQNVVGNWLMLISQILITNAAAQALIERRVHGPIMNTNSKEVKNSYDPIKYNIESLRNVLKEIYPDQMKNVFNNLKQGIGSIEDKYNNLHN